MTPYELRLELIQESPPERRCPYLRLDVNVVCYCERAANVFDGVMVTDNASLQLWCLDPERRHLCILYPKPEATCQESL